MPPQIVRVGRQYKDSDRLSLNEGDFIAIVDGRSELKFAKGQNQRTFEIGIFPRYDKC